MTFGWACPAAPPLAGVQQMDGALELLTLEATEGTSSTGTEAASTASATAADPDSCSTRYIQWTAKERRIVDMGKEVYTVIARWSTLQHKHLI